MSFSSDPTLTAVRVQRLETYMRDSVMGPDKVFVCESEPACRASMAKKTNCSFTAGQLSHVGRHYDLLEDGRPLRMLVIAMETGGTDVVTLAERRLRIERSASQGYAARNAHMKGTTRALLVAIGRDPVTGASETVDLGGQPAHLFDCYAMANLRLCSATKIGSRESRATSTMSANCLRHLAATIEILEPTLCIVQGSSVAADLEPIIRDRIAITSHLDSVILAGQRTLLAAFTHPSARVHAATRAPLGWGRADQTYLRSTVVPALQRARRELSNTAS